MTIHAVIDTNVLVSSMLTKNRKAATARLIDALIDNRFCPVYNKDIIDEYAEVLRRAEFHFDTDAVEGIIGIVRENGLYAERTPTNDPVIDPKDVAFYEVALTKKRFISCNWKFEAFSAKAYCSDSCRNDQNTRR